MSENESGETQSEDDLTKPDKSQKPLPYEDIISQIVAKIRVQPFLFVIAIVALLIGLALLTTNLGSPDIRFIVGIIALLSSTVIFGYYTLAVLQLRGRMQKVGYIEVWKCSKCGHMNMWENYYCNNCKHKWKEKSKDLHMWKCTKCDEFNMWENDYCGKCNKFYKSSY